LAEVLLAIMIVCFVSLAALSALNASRIQRVKDHDQGIMQDFAVHYLELVKAMPFDKIKMGTPINDLFDGTNGAPLVIIPKHTNWFPLGTADYENFHPELVWLTNRDPRMQIILTTSQVSGLDHTKHLQLGLRWLPPLHNGTTQSIRVDLIRVKDL
jgi:hypothetical protein